MARYINKPFTYLEDVIGVEVNFNKVFYRMPKLDDVADILKDLEELDLQLRSLQEGISS